MDFEIGDVIYYIGIAVFFLYSFLKKKKKQEGKTGSPSDNIPDFDSFLKKIRPKNEEKNSSPSLKDNAIIKPKSKLEQQPVKKQKKQTALANTIKDENQDEIFTDFDLKQAVINTIILSRPKHFE